MTLFVLIRDDGVAHFATLDPTEELFFHRSKQSPMALVQASEGSGWQVNRGLIADPEAYRLTFPTFYRYFADPPGLIGRVVSHEQSSQRVEVVHIG